MKGIVRTKVNLESRRGYDRGLFSFSSRIELPKSKLRSALQSAAETSWRELRTAQESGRAVQLDSGADPDSPDSGPEHSAPLAKNKGDGTFVTSRIRCRSNSPLSPPFLG